MARAFFAHAGCLALALSGWMACSDVSTDPQQASSKSSGAGAAGGGGAASVGSSASSGAVPSTASAGGMSALGGASGGGTGGDSGGGGSDTTIVLDAQTLEFFDLPIGSVRSAVGGHHQASNTCVTLIWFAGAGQQVCAGSTPDTWPYVVVTPNAQPPCTQWDYGGNVMVDAASGCVQFSDTFPLSATIEMSVTVSGGSLTGTVLVDNVP